MISEQVRDYIKDLVINNIQEYQYYICYTNTNNNYNNNEYDVYCSFSNDITINGYTFSIDDGIHYQIDTSSYNSNYALEKNNLYTGSKYTTIPNYESIFTNVNKRYNNIISDFEYLTSYNKEYNIAYNLDLNIIYLIIILLVLPICIGFTHHFFRIK